MTISFASGRAAFRGLTAVVLAAGVLGGCGDGDDGGGDLGADDGGAMRPDAGPDAPRDAGPPDAGPPDAGSPDEPYTEAQVQRLFDDRGCSQAGCHAAATQRAGLSLEGFADDTVGVRSTQSRLDLIAPGDHQASYLWHKVNGTHVGAGGRGSRMPLARLPLEDIEIARLAAYIDALPVE